ncbi:hypothetical protein GCM10007967_28940 [Xylanimonas ulmi]
MPRTSALTLRYAYGSGCPFERLSLRLRCGRVPRTSALTLRYAYGSGCPFERLSLRLRCGRVPRTSALTLRYAYGSGVGTLAVVGAVALAGATLPTALAHGYSH